MVLLLSQKVTNNLIFISLLSFLFSCQKLINVDAPQTSINQENVFNSDATAIAAITSIYANMSDYSETAGFAGPASLSVLLGLSADELTLYSGVTDNKLNAYYKNALVARLLQNYGSEPWPFFYNYIFRCNAIIEGLNASTSVSPSVKKQLIGEAKFMRALFYFYLTGLYQSIPLALTTDPTINDQLSQVSPKAIYKQAILDLKDSQPLLSLDFLNGNLLKYAGEAERVRPTKWAAAALLARVYLYTEDYQNADSAATSVIDQTSLFGLETLNKVFLKNSREAIWQLQPVRSNRNTEDAFVFILPLTGPTGSANLNPVYLSKQLLNSFEKDDQRRLNWVDSVIAMGSIYYYPYKYKATTATGSPTEYMMMLRLAEQYLIRAEARVQESKIPEGKLDLNAIRTRAGLSDVTYSDKISLLTAIMKERQVELFTELGQRWLDLRRTHNIDTVMSRDTPLKGGVWNTNWQLYPLPIDDIQRNPQLKQNPGY